MAKCVKNSRLKDCQQLTFFPENLTGAVEKQLNSKKNSKNSKKKKL